MNLLLHDVGSQDYEHFVVSNSLAADPGERFELILANPYFRDRITRESHSVYAR